MKMYARPSSFCSFSSRFHYLGLDGNVERRHRLVADDHLRVQRQPTRNPDPLSLTSGELVRIPVDVLRVEPYQVQQLLHPLPAIALGQDIGGFQTARQQCRRLSCGSVGANTQHDCDLGSDGPGRTLSTSYARASRQRLGYR
jgi:hypothetical protein